MGFELFEHKVALALIVLIIQFNSFFQ
jgi:hypothetical protein